MESCHLITYIFRRLSSLAVICVQPARLNSSLPGQNGRHFADDIFRRLFMNEKYENLCIFIRISLKFVPKGPIDN